jgi:hypothetical protein
MRGLLSRAVLAGVLGLSGVLGVAAIATAAPPPPAQVTLDGVGLLGRYDDALVSGSLRCQAGSVEPELVVRVTQGMVTGASAVNNVACDGAWHRFTVSVFTVSLDGPYVPGDSWVDARLTVHDPASHDPLPQGHDANNVWLRPNAKITPVWPLVINDDGTMTVTMYAVCRGPWAASSISVQLNRTSDLLIVGTAYLESPPVICDGQRHWVEVVVEPIPGITFVEKPLRVTLFFSIWDEADTGDPINGVSWEGQIRVVRD